MLADSFLEGLRHHLYRKEKRAISIINSRGNYIYNSLHPDYVTQERSFFQEGAYTAAVEGQKPYSVTEFPAHYQKGDPWWKGLFDEDHFLSYARVPDFDWLILVRDHGDTLDDYLKQVLAVTLLLLAVTVILTIMMAGVMTRNIIIPIETMIKGEFV